MYTSSANQPLNDVTRLFYVIKLTWFNEFSLCLQRVDVQFVFFSCCCSNTRRRNHKWPTSSYKTLNVTWRRQHEITQCREERCSRCWWSWETDAANFTMCNVDSWHSATDHVRVRSKWCWHHYAVLVAYSSLTCPYMSRREINLYIPPRHCESVGIRERIMTSVPGYLNTINQLALTLRCMWFTLLWQIIAVSFIHIAQLVTGAKTKTRVRQQKGNNMNTYRQGLDHGRRQCAHIHEHTHTHSRCECTSHCQCSRLFLLLYAGQG